MTEGAARERTARLAADFRSLHRGRPRRGPLVLPGPWDAGSARVLAGAGFPALATPSAGVAASLGYEDGRTPADEMFAAVARIVRAVDVPVSADLEAGYGLPPRELAARVRDAGLAGVNLEDSGDFGSGRAGGAGAAGTTSAASGPGGAGAPSGGGLRDAGAHAAWLAEFREEAGGELFLNARVDTYRHGVTDPEETVRRCLLYVEAGADGVYPILAPPEHLPLLAAEVPVPVNALALPGGPGVAELGRLGAGRVTFGAGMHGRTMAALRAVADEVRPAG
ncbi:MULTISPECIES: isocitrate lyase/PEP mutase family protein [Streptomyces]|uniref:Carboxyvinyl-carboxyphosphonate phosphorylmutase n=2 Tax=Streptomyces TaxID=1883 RepID=A0A100Y1L1_9ACTN|nr:MULTISPECIES: isocitrate lyase/phosphoenolpyruvate mutase family protein [Streptomyces]KUH35953.1 carboxyvinyl-carboxyphosphonate phosphorylmutase [Streptomyces kanasensis]UUS32610.1 isocitrate lyase/phosphoenolpyruvate mutase family protein [Streptomyces changanensis]